MKNRIDTSRQKTPWDNDLNLSATQKFIKLKYKENYKLKHSKLSETNEKEIINSIVITKCKFCDSEQIIKRGFTNNGIQRYYCNCCHKRFTPITNTIFDNHKISITEWIEFLLDLFNYGSTTLISKVNKNSINTSIYWLQKVFLLLRHWQDNIVLKGTVYIDEMFYSVIKSDIKTKDGKKLRGLSCNQYCIGIGIKKLELVDDSYKSTWLKTKKDKDNPLRPINHQCDLIRQFLNTHSGFDRDNLQDYLNLYCFMNSKPRNKLEKVNILLELALSTNIELKYRDFSKIPNS